jgi:hypothetical protein
MYDDLKGIVYNAKNLLDSVRVPGDLWRFKRVEYVEAFGQQLALDATVGFLGLPTCAGAPTGVPSRNGAMVYDTTNNRIYVYNGGWKKTAALT